MATAGGGQLLPGDVVTTIAWDGKTLAADTRNTVGGFAFSALKIWRLSNGRLFGAAGNAEDCEAARIWLEHEEGKKPEVKDYTGGEVTTLDLRVASFISAK